MHSYILTGIRMGSLMKLLRRNGLTPTPRNVGRLIFLLQNAFWASFHTWRENKRYRRILSSFPVPDEILIIIGHWRTGTTFLHQLLAQDPQLITPSLFQVGFPECFLSSEKYYRPLIGMLVKKRPMDNVKLGFDDAQEDEFALVRLNLESPLLDVVFPQGNDFFLNHYEDFNPPPEKKEMWKKNLITFCSKIRRDSGRIMLLKNPFHSLRIPLLLETFPNAKFIHLHRHPYAVVASSLHLWTVMAKDNQLKGKPYVPTLEEVTDCLVKFYRVISKEAEKLPDSRYCEVSYETLEKNPIAEIMNIYQKMNLPYTDTYKSNINSFLEKTKDFKKNAYFFSDEAKKRVYQKMKMIFEQYNYKP